MGTGGDLRWLEQRGHTWYAVQDVPRPLRARLGKRRLIKSLGTREIHVARSRRHEALATFARVFAEAQRSVGAADFVARGLEWRQTFTELKRDSATPSLGRSHEEGDEPPLAVAGVVFEDELESIEQVHGSEAARLTSAVAYGQATPLLHFVSEWLAEGGSKEVSPSEQNFNIGLT